MNWIVRRLMRLTQSQKLFGQSFVTAITFYFGKILSQELVRVTRLAGTAEYLLDTVVFVGLLTVLVVIYRLIQSALQREQQELEKQREILFHAHQVCDRVLVRQLERLEKARLSSEEFNASFCENLGDIKAIVEGAYETFEAAYGKAASPAERVDFEVTYMTKSLRDGEITIPAAWNKDGRAPRSMTFREQNKKIYDTSLTAKIFRLPSPRLEIVSDTSEEDYTELYPGQKERIQSSIVYPVLSKTNNLLGTLVVHCNRKGFFQNDKKKFWADLLEIFAKRLAFAATNVLLLNDMKRLGANVDIANMDTAPY